MTKTKTKTSRPEYFFYGCCVDFENLLEEHRAMMETAETVDYQEMLANCDGLLDWATGVGYDEDLPLEEDKYIGFYKSTFGGTACYYVSWSAFEFVWTKPAIVRSGRMPTEKPNHANRPRTTEPPEPPEHSRAYRAGKSVTRGSFAQDRFSRECGLQTRRTKNP